MVYQFVVTCPSVLDNCQKMKCILSLALLASIAIISYASPVEVEQGSKILVCYYGSWAVYRPGNGKFDVEDLDPSICTHIIYGFAGLSLTGELKILDEYNDLEENFGRGAMRRFTNLKEQNPSLKVLLAIGGWNDCEPLVGNNCEKYADMVMTQASRRKFIDTVVPFIQLYNFDGFDLDWEYPTFRGGRPSDKEGFTLLCQEMREEFDKHGWLLTSAVSAGEPTIEEAYDVPAISRSLDFINVMAYDLHGGWENFTHHHAAFGQMSLDDGNNTMLNVKHAIEFWMAKGAPANKLVLGMGSYGRGWLLDDQAINGYYAPANALIDAGPYTREPGIWGYNEVLEKIMGEGGWNVVRDSDVVGPYATKGRQWIGYDDEISIGERVRYILEKGLLGGMFWSVETDDFLGLHSSEKFPLIKTARRALSGGVIPTPGPTTTTTTTTPDPTAPTTTATTAAPMTTPPSDGICREVGLIADPTDCKSYYNCVPTDSGFDAVRETCVEGTIFDPRTTQCSWYDDVPDAEERCGWIQ